jgi:alpha-1,3-mannosyl-glycoprotein beta-1,2-N-acetylglucosaminyltransferase
MGLLLVCAALIWIMGIVAFLGQQRASNDKRAVQSSGSKASGSQLPCSAIFAHRHCCFVVLFNVVAPGGGATKHSLPGQQTPMHAHHSHRQDLMPPPAPEHRSSSHNDGVAVDAGGGDAGVDAPSEVGRGFGFNKLANLQREISQELHHFFKHDQHAEEEGEEEGEEPATEEQQNGNGAAPVAAPAAPPTFGFVNPAIVILTYSRRKYLLRTLDSLVIAPGVEKFTLYVSQDAGPKVPDLSDLPLKYSGSDLHLMRHPRTPLLSPDQSATAYLAQHYKWVLDRLFLAEHGRRHSHVVIMEDDMLVASDFLTLFSETAALLDSDPTLWCVSSWNDNGMTNLVADQRKLMRTDYFPGLGWMTNRNIWAELSPSFPLDQWDHHMRLDTVHKGRDCIIPEVARNHNIGKEGTNMGDRFYERYLAPVALATGPPVSFLRPELDDASVSATSADADSQVILAPGMEFLRSDAYERDLEARVKRAKVVGRSSDPGVLQRLKEAMATPARLPSSDPPATPEEEEWLVLYEHAHYPSLATALGLLPVPRSVHRGLSQIRLGAHVVFLADIKVAGPYYLSPEQRFERDPSLRPTRARQNEPCTTACARIRNPILPGVDGPPMRCSQSHFQFINHCSVLLEVSPDGCPRGCRGGVSGLDVPNYVDNPDKPELFGFCLTTEDESTCEAQHWSASRLCPCVDAPTPA